MINLKCPFGSASHCPLKDYRASNWHRLMLPERSVCASCCSKHFSRITHWILMTALFKVIIRSSIF